MAHQYRVSVDIEYLDGTFAGMVIPAGFSVREPDARHAIRTSRWLANVKRDNDFVRATGTGNKYRIVGRISIDKLEAS